MKSIVLRSPAKLNLFLKVSHKRPDGYHNLVTLFERIDLCDEIRFSLNRTGKIRISCNDPDVPCGPKNLIYKVAQLLKKDFVLSLGVDVKITKRIPVAAGLGGGSSNAATALKGLNQLWGLRLSKAKLVEYGRAIGSDVPFFLYNCRWAIGTERGDVIKPVFLRTKLWHVLITPRIKVYSAEVFKALGLSPKSAQRARMNMLTKIKDDVNILLRALRKNDRKRAGALLYNGLEPAIIKLYPRLLRVKVKLTQFENLGVSFSGSGPSVFCITESRLQAQKLSTVLHRYYQRTFSVATF